MEDEGDEDRAIVTAKDFMNDFATEEFMGKNIRVRPISSHSRKEEDQPGKSDIYGGPGDEEEKFNQMKIIEMMEERTEIKKKKEELERKKKLEEEKLLKKRR